MKKTIKGKRPFLVTQRLLPSYKTQLKNIPDKAIKTANEVLKTTDNKGGDSKSPA